MSIKRIYPLIAVLAAFLITASTAQAQLTPWKAFSLLDENTVDLLVGEISGERINNHQIELAAYNRPRSNDQYGDNNYPESEYVLAKLKEYGLAGAQIERFPGGETWDAIKGIMWETSPHLRKIADYESMPAQLSPNSETTKVETQLVWVGDGTPAEFKNVDVKGKIAVSHQRVSALSQNADKYGAVGVVSIWSGRPTYDPKQILWTSIRTGKTVKFGFSLTLHKGLPLKDRLVAGEKIIVNVDIESQTMPYALQVPTAYIQGTDSNADEIILSAHLYEGYQKQGANDDISGCAVDLEIARALQTMIDDGRIKRPRRTIRFIWVPEYSGTYPWTAAHMDIMDKTLCNINMDMVSAWLSKNYSLYSVMRTTFGNPHYVNDVVEHYMKYVGQTNREILQNRRGEKILKPIMATTGSDEPFTFSIETHYGSSDHEVFNSLKVRVPGVLMITWPDQFYHTSNDRPENSDPTQSKRAAFITAASALVIASAGDDMAMRIGSEVVGNANMRIGHQLVRGMDALQDANVENFGDLALRNRGHIEGASINEVATLGTILELADNKKLVGDYIKGMTKSLNGIKDATLNAFDTHANVAAGKLGTKISTKLTKAEKAAAKIIATPLPDHKNFDVRALRRDNPDIFKKYPNRTANVNEINLLINGKLSALDIKKMLDVQYDREADLQDVINHLNLLEELKLIKK